MADLSEYRIFEGVEFREEVKTLMQIFADSWDECRKEDCSQCKYRHGKEQYTLMACLSERYAEKLIAADVAPVRHGRWIKGGYVCGENAYECSVCHETEWRPSASRMNIVCSAAQRWTEVERMREILFRGKRMDTGEWVYGWPFADTADCSLKKNGKCICQHDGSEFFIVEWVDIYHEYEEQKVIPETVGQFTGLLDKNGKRIFEGDIVSTDIERPYLIVEFRDGCFMFNCNDGGEDYYDIMLPILKDPQSVYKYGEVIGTIHDNPELLKVTPNE